MQYLIYPLSIAMTLLFAIYSKWQFSDDRGETSGKWHPYGAAMRAGIFVVAAACSYFPASWQDIVLAGAINLFVWDMAINIIALNKPVFYSGSTAETDKSLKNKKWFVWLAILIVAIILKIFV